MFHSRKLNNSINMLHEHALGSTYSDQNSSFEFLLQKDSSTNIRVKNLKVMLTKVFKTKSDQNADFMREVFPLRNNSYNLRYNNEFLQPKVKTFSYGIETLPSHIKSSTSLKDFKRKIRNWHPDCDCRLCRPYIPPQHENFDILVMENSSLISSSGCLKFLYCLEFNNL